MSPRSRGSEAAANAMAWRWPATGEPLALKRSGKPSDRSPEGSPTPPQWFWDAGPDLCIRWVSQSTDATLAVGQPQLVGLNLAAVAAENSDATRRDRIARLIDQRKPFSGLRCGASGLANRSLTFQLAGVPVSAEDGSFHGYRGSISASRLTVGTSHPPSAAQQRLADVIESFSDGFALFDATDRLVLCNDTYRRTLAAVADRMRLGAFFHDLMAALVETGTIRPAASDPRAWLASWLVERQRGCIARSFQTPDGRWIENREYPTPDGGRVVVHTDVTDRHLAEEALRRSEASLVNAQRIARVGSWDLRIGTGQIWWSDEMYRILGEPIRGAVASLGRLMERTHPDDRTRFAEAVAAGGAFAMECRMIRPDGGERTVLQEGEVTTDEAGAPRLSVVVFDITDRRQAERALSETEERFRVAFETCPDAVSISRLSDGRYLDVNEGFTALFGHRRSDVIGRTSFEIGLWADPDARAALIDRLHREGEARNVEVDICHKDGCRRTVLVSAALCSFGGELHLLANAKDITEAKRAEAELRASEERFRSLIESAFLGIAIEQNGQAVFVNRTFATMFGYADPAEVLNLGCLDPLYAGSDRARLEDLRRALPASGELSPEQFELSGVRKDGSPIWLHTQIRTVPWNGEVAVQFTVIDVSLRKNYEEQLHRRANFDAVTELPNRTLATDRLRQAVAVARRRRQKVGVLFVDVDHFKKINDSFGHTIGDIFLRQLADRLRAAVRREDTVARLGGDEFLVILPAVHARGDAVAVAHKIIDSVASPFVLEGQEAFVSVSVGVSVAPDDAEDAEIILRNADSAMYLAKEKGRGTIGFFTPELDERLRRRVQMEAAMRHALEREEFTLSFQPVFDVRQGAVIGAEALLRWTSAEFGVVGPEEFVQVAEDTGLIVPIGGWVLQTACREARRWADDGFDSLRLSVNVSSRQFRGPSLLEAVDAALDRNRLAPDCLQLEITETLLMEDIAEIKQTLHRLETCGVRLAVDDFGTGYSSLSYLSRFPLDTVKIDRVFIHDVDQDPARAALVEAIIDIADRLNLDVVAEGVEREQELAFLAARNCQYAQGYLFSQPLSADAFRRFLRRAAVFKPATTARGLPEAGGPWPAVPAG